jgi:hypothetical protein
MMPAQMKIRRNERTDTNKVRADKVKLDCYTITMACKSVMVIFLLAGTSAILDTM